MLRVETEIGPVAPFVVEAFAMRNVFGLFQRFAQYGTYHILVAHFRAESRFPETAGKVTVQVYPVSAGPVVIKLHFAFISPDEFETVVGLRPINRGREMENSLRFGLYRSKVFAGMFELIGILGAVKCIRSVIFVRITGLPLYIYLFMGKSSLVKSPLRFKVAVVGSAVAPVQTARKLVAYLSFCIVEACASPD